MPGVTRGAATRKLLDMRRLVAPVLAVSGLTLPAFAFPGVFDAAKALVDTPAVTCSVTGNTLDVQITGQSTPDDAVGVSASGGDYLIYLGAADNPQCTVGGPYALTDDPVVDVSSTGNMSQYVALDDSDGGLASTSAGCPVSITVALDAPSSGTDTVALLDDTSSPQGDDDTVAVSSAASSGSTSEALNLSEGGCGSPDVNVPTTTSPPNVFVAGQNGGGDVLDLSSTTSSSSSSITVGVNGDSASSPGSVSGLPGPISVGFSGVETVVGAGVDTDFQPGSASGVAFEGQAGVTNTLDLSGEVAPAGDLLVKVADGSLEGTSTAGTALTDSFSGVTAFEGAPVGTTFAASSDGGFAFGGAGDATTTLDLGAAPSSATVDAATGTVAGLSAGVGSATTDDFSGIEAFTGSAAGSTTFTAAGSGGLTFTGQGTGDSLDLGPAPSGATVDAATGTVSGLSAGVGSATTDDFSGIETFLGSTSGSTTFTAKASGGLTFTGRGTGNALDLAAAPSGATVDAATGTVSGLSAGVGSATTDSFAGIQTFTGSASGSTTFTAKASGGLTFTGEGTGNSLDLAAAPSGTAVDAATGAVSGLSAGIGSATTDSFSDIQTFTGSAAGSTTFTAAGSGGLTFTGEGAGNSLDLGAAPPGATVDLSSDAVSGLTAGVGSATTDDFSDIASFTGSLPPTEPTEPVASPLDGAASVSFVAPTVDFGSAILSYTVTATDLTTPSNGGEHGTGSASPVTVSGLTNGDSYEFTVTATNGNGTGPASAESSAVTPKQVQTVRFTTATPNETRVGGAPYLPVATSTSGLEVTISLDPTSTGCVLDNGVVSFPNAGVCIIEANQAGNGEVAPAPTVRQRIVVLKALNAITITSAPPSHPTVPRAYRPTARATSGDPVLVRVALHVSACTIDHGLVTFRAQGICVLVFVDAGNARFLGATSAVQRFVVDRGMISLRAAAIPRAAASSTAITLRAVVSSPLAHGAVRFSIGRAVLCAAVLHGRVASCRVRRVLGRGVYRVTATYLGSAGFAPASVVTDFKVA